MAENKKPVDHYFSESSTWFDSNPIKREATYTGREITKSLNDSVWAGSNLLAEEIELEQNLKDLIEAEEDYKTIEDYLHNFGYPKVKIRKAFQEIIGVDPIKTYLDTENFPKPPSVIPRYNYGWGEKSAGVYMYVLPYTNRYAIWRQEGLKREVYKIFITIKQAKEALIKEVKEVKEVSADAGSKSTEYLIEDRIIKRVSKLDIPKEVTDGFRSVFASIQGFEYNVPRNTKVAFIKNAHCDGEIDISEKDFLIRYVKAQEDDLADEEKSLLDKMRKEKDESATVEDVKKEVEKYQKNRSQKSLEDIKEEIKIPQKDFDEEVSRRRSMDLKDLVADGFEMLDEVKQEILSYEIKVIGESADKIRVDEYSSMDESHIDTGSVTFIVEFKDLETGNITEGGVIMFIKGGDLQFPGKFKGSNDREYALMDTGIASYFDDITGDSIERAEEEGPRAKSSGDVSGVQEKAYSSFGFGK